LKGKKAAEVIEAFKKDAKKYDPQGSYTGDTHGKPVQDADDL